eukprot:2636693-Amphidinium_carterae.1
MIRGSHRPREVAEAPTNTIIRYHGNFRIDKYFAVIGFKRFRRYNKTTTIYNLTTIMMTYLSTMCTEFQGKLLATSFVTTVLQCQQSQHAKLSITSVVQPTDISPQLCGSGTRVQKGVHDMTV